MEFSAMTIKRIDVLLAHSSFASFQIYALYFIPEKDIKVSDFGKNPVMKKTSNPAGLTRETEEKKTG